MPRPIHKLSHTKIISSSILPGRHSDGGGLYLNVKSPSAKSWLFMWVVRGKRHALGLGSFPYVSLASARVKSYQLRLAVIEGENPRHILKPVTTPTFKECVSSFLQIMESEWSNPKHRNQWRMTLGKRYCSSILDLPINEITTNHISNLLLPIWKDKNETASRLRGRIERVFDFANTQGRVSLENPARWKGNLQNVLPPRKKLQRGHHKAMPYGEVPNFITKLNNLDTHSAKALKLLILTATRTSEVLNARVSEIDLNGRVWTIPAQRMKGRKEHRIPLSGHVINFIAPYIQDKKQDEYIFPGLKAGKPLSNMSMEMLLRRLKIENATVHGFRSSFRDWCGDETDYPREVAEAALAHTIKNATERAYRRLDAFEKRKNLMDMWSKFCTYPFAHK